ncbi:MAG: cation:dicarboxylase symporter family transporter [Verrucomicrobiota bacterium]
MKELRLVFLPAGAGILAGLFFGEYCAWLSPFGSAYVMLLQAAVYPYVITSLLHGLGNLRPDQAFKLFHRGWFIYLLAWILTFFALLILGFGMPAAFPPVASDAGFDAARVLNLIIPQDIVGAIANNYVPAVVVFCTIYGVALQRVEDRGTLLSVLDAIKRMSLQFWRWIVKLVPVAVFALVANTAGTTALSNLEHVGFFLILLFGLSAILAFWMLPAIIAALTPLSFREVLSSLREAMVVSLATTLSVTALPYISELSRKFANQLGIEGKEPNEVVETNLSITYVFGQLGNFFVLAFILFAIYFFQSPLPFGDRLLLPFMTFLSNVGSPTATVNGVSFLSMWLNLPDTASSLFVELLVIIRYAMLMTSVAGFAFLSILVTLSYFGKLRFQPIKLAKAITLPLVAIAVLSLGTRAILSHVAGDGRRPYLNFALSQEVTDSVPYEILTKQNPSDQKDRKDTTSHPVMERIQRTGELRVGYNAGIIPMCYHNADGDLVGYDIEAAFSLAQSLDVKLTFVPFEWQSLVDDLNANKFDIAMAGIYVTDQRIRELNVSTPYYSSPIALFAPRNRVARLNSRKAIDNIDGLRAGVFDDPVLIPRLKRLLPNADVVIVDSYQTVPDFSKIDFAIWTLEQAKALAEANPEIQAIVPKDMGSNFLFAYLMPRDASEWKQYVDYWIEIKNRSGELKAAKDYWIDGKPRPSDTPRWSILRNVLHWVN